MPRLPKRRDVENQSDRNANGNTHGISPDVLIRDLAATGHRVEVPVKRAAA